MAFQKSWWTLNEHGQRIGFMEPVVFETILASHYGNRQWVRAFHELTGSSKPAIYRWSQGLNPIPKHIALIVMMLDGMGGPDKLPQETRDWLEEISKLEEQIAKLKAESTVPDAKGKAGSTKGLDKDAA